MAKLGVTMHPSNDKVVEAEKATIQMQADVGKYISWVNATICRSAVRDAWHSFGMGFSGEKPTKGKQSSKASSWQLKTR